MLKEVLASNVAKLVAACVCPVVGASAIALKVPQVRSAVHKATSPKAERQARAKPRTRTPEKVAARKDADEAPVQTAMMCSNPLTMNDSPLRPVSFDTLPAPTRDFSTPAPPSVFPGGGCGAVGIVGGGRGAMMTFAAIPEPATWAQMIAGFGLLGGVLRVGRRRRDASLARA